MKCANCNNPAVFIYDITPKVNIPYCGEHLPRFLEPRKKAGLLRTTDTWEKERKIIVEKLAPVIVEPVIEDSPEQAPIVEEAVDALVEAPAQKKSAKKTDK